MTFTYLFIFIKLLPVLPSCTDGQSQSLHAVFPQNMWAAFMQAVEGLAQRHPYMVTPTAGRVGQWGMCFALASLTGCASIDPDGGSYPQVSYPLPRTHITWLQP